MQINGNRPRILLLENAESICQNIFAEDKATRKNARALIIENLVDYITDPDAFHHSLVEHSHYFVVSVAVGLFIKKNQFIFEIKDAAGSILSSKTELKRSCGPHSNLHVDSNQPTYVVIMPHLASGKHSLDDQVNLLFKEGFGFDENESRLDAGNRLHLFVGVNYCHSLDPSINKVKRKYINDLLKLPPKPNVSVEAFCWTPEWKYPYLLPMVPKPPISKSKKSLKEVKIICPYLDPIKKKHILPSTVKRLFRLLQEIDSAKASIIFKQLIEKKVIPFQRIREEIKNSPSLQTYFRPFRATRIDRPCYLMTADDDAVKLRTNGLGLFSNYDELIQSHLNLEVATTGYYMADTNNRYVEIASITNLLARQAIAHLRPNGAYLPEPNMIIKIPSGFSVSPNISFLRKKGELGKSLESIGMLENLGLMKGDVRGRVVFGHKGAIETGVSPNVKIPTHLRNDVTSQSFRSSENLDSLRSFSQSAINPLYGFGANILRSFPEGTNKKKIQGKVSQLFTSVDPIEYAKSIPSIWLEAYPSVVNEVIHSCNEKYYQILSDPENLNDYFRIKAISIINVLNLNVMYIPTIAKLIKEKSFYLIEAREALSNTKKFTNDDLDIQIKTSLNVSETVYYYLKSIIKNEPFQFSFNYHMN